MRRIVYLFAILVMLFSLTACAGKEETTAEEMPVEETKQEEISTKIFGTFDTQTIEGEHVTEEIFAQADLTMVNIWGTFCGPCINEMPDLGEISREYEEKGFQIVGLLSDVSEAGDATALQIIEETKADYTHIVASDDLVENVLQYVSAVPTTIFVDKEGNVVGEVQMGSRNKNQWELLINNLLAGVQ